MATRQQSAPPNDGAPHPADADNQHNQQQRSNLPVPVQPTAGVVAAAGETSSAAIAAREKAAVEARFLVAMNRPRDFEKARLRLLQACERPRFAEVARYAKPVGRDKVFGLSIRYAEEARVLWGNMDVSAFLVFDDDERRIYRVISTDLETNATDGVDIMVEKFVERRVVRPGMEVVGQRANTHGEIVYKIRATEDDLIVKVNNQIAKARRNVILTLIPGDVKEECEERIVETVANRDKKDPEGAKKAVLEAFFKLGVGPDQVAELLGHPLEQLNPAELTLLRSYYTALKDGEATWADIFEAHTRGKPASVQGEGAAATSSAPARGTVGLKDSLKQKAGNGSNGEQTKQEQPPKVKLFSDCTKRCVIVKTADGEDIVHADTCVHYGD